MGRRRGKFVRHPSLGSWLVMSGAGIGVVGTIRAEGYDSGSWCGSQDGSVGERQHLTFSGLVALPVRRDSVLDWWYVRS